MSTPNIERIRLWYNDLLETDAAQARTFLHKVDSTGVESFCCLGRACEVAITNGLQLTIEPGLAAVAYDGMESVLPDSVRDWYGIGKADPYLLAADGENATASYLNDSKRWTFKQIAEALHRTYLEPKP